MEHTPSTPSEIAREVLRRLAMSRIPPTPENFRDHYFKIAGTPPDESFPEREMRSLASQLPRERPEQMRIARRFEGAIAERDWALFHERMLQLLQECAETSPPWGVLIRDLLVQLERRHANLSQSRKREALEHVLAASQADAQQLFQRLQGLVRGWSSEADASTITLVDTPVESEAAAAAIRPVDPAASALAVQPHPAAPGAALGATPAAPTASGTDITNPLRPLLAKLLQEAIGALLIDTPALSEEAGSIAAELRATDQVLDIAGFGERLESFTYKVQWVVQDQGGIRSALLKLLQLIVENINDLLLDDAWMQGQLAGVLEITSQPLGRDNLDELARRLRDVITKQGTLKSSIVEAQTRLKEMLTGFVDHLSDFYDSTGEYGDRMEFHADQIAKAGSMAELSEVIGTLIGETRAIQTRAERSRGELAEMRTRVDRANRQISELQSELEATSELVRHDPLTGTLNRKGLDEAIEREVGRMQRSGKPLCLALIDVDNFKALNDTHGHRAGDDALLHLAHVIEDTVRPHDSVARYGGEEFVLVLPDTPLDIAVGVVQRLQRELTRRFFLHENSKVLITFSAGVSQLNDGENPQHAIDRADDAMYRAKRGGKNRVEAAS